MAAKKKTSAKKTLDPIEEASVMTWVDYSVPPEPKGIVDTMIDSEKRKEEERIQKGIKDWIIYRDEEWNIHNLTEQLPDERRKNPKMRYTVTGTPEIVTIEDESILQKDKNWLTMKQEMFCQYYVCHEPSRFNWRQSYALAYSYNLEKADTQEIRDELSWKIIKRSERVRMENICDVWANHNLSIPKVQSRITKLLNEMMNDEIVDSEMAKMILWPDWESKRAMIREYNKIKQRITDKTKDESESDKAKAELYKSLESQIKTMPKEQVSQVIQDLLTPKK